jgi:hypothetical protein
MYYGSVFIVAMILTFVAGAGGSIFWFIFSICLFIVAMVLAKIERSNQLHILISLALICLGAAGGLSWPVIRYPLAVSGLILMLILKPGRQ